MPIAYNTRWTGEIAATDMPPTSIGLIVAPSALAGTFVKHELVLGLSVWRELKGEQRDVIYGPGVRVTCIDMVTLDEDGNVVDWKEPDGHKEGPVA